MTDALMLFQLGPDAAHHLARALDDRDRPVARFAARRLVELGGVDSLQSWCAENATHRNHDSLCEDVEEQAQELTAMTLDGHWTVSPNVSSSVGVADMDHTPELFELTEHAGAVTGRVCFADDTVNCVDVTGKRSGQWVELSWGEDDRLLHRRAVVSLNGDFIGGELVSDDHE